MSHKNNHAKAIALYLPQFHPIPENDEWWGRGFTEWTNTAKAKPLFKGHYQPHIPADLGFYDLRVSETREAQAEMARKASIYGFCYYHYWFAGRRILERPFNEVLASKKPDAPFCLCWANESWTGIWHGAPGKTLIEQTYPGENDHRAHFEALLPAFLDDRYMKQDGKPIFLLYKPEKLPDSNRTLDLWRELAVRNGLPGIHFVGMNALYMWRPEQHGFDAKILLPFVTHREWVSKRRPIAWLRKQIEIKMGLPVFHEQTDINEKYLATLAHEMEKATKPTYPCLVHAWDNTPRAKENGVVMTGSSPELYGNLIKRSMDIIKIKPAQDQLVFLKAWNEWAEGNHLEPDLRNGDAYLNQVSKHFSK